MIKKNYLFFEILIICLLLPTILYANLNEKLIKKIEDTNTLSFEFKQKIAEKVEEGECIIKYSKLMRCDYNDKYKKRLISNGKTLVIIQRRYKKIFYYPLKTTPLYYILDKKYLIQFIKNNEVADLNDKFIKYEIKEKNRKLIILFDRDTLNLKGWKTEDIYKKKVDFIIDNLKINIPMDKNLFKIPDPDNL